MNTATTQAAACFWGLTSSPSMSAAGRTGASVVSGTCEGERTSHAADRTSFSPSA